MSCSESIFNLSLRMQSVYSISVGNPDGEDDVGKLNGGGGTGKT
jgi:hypothetical protein